MMDNIDLNKYLKKYKNLHVDRNNTKYTVGKAPHKPILLLSLILLHKNNKIDLTNVSTNIYLRDTWVELWNCLDYDKVGPIHLPLYHLKSDGFWNIDFKTTPTQPKSLTHFNKMVKSIHLDQELIDFISDRKTRHELINSLLNGGYFSDTEIQNLKTKIKTIERSFVYEEKLNSLIKNEFVPDYTTLFKESKPLRSAAFRRLVLSSYNETCSVCGIRLITSTGISIIDAAHILPFSKFQNDDIRNGIALCKRHHWLFDKGLMTVDPHYRVLVSRSIEEEYPSKVISGFNKNEILLPQEAEKYPSPLALEWHREKVFQD